MKTKFTIFLLFCLTLFSWATFASADYSAQGIVESKNMLSGATVTAINGFQVTATVPANTTVSVKFSQDKVNYYNSAGVKEGWDTCANGVTNVNLTGLAWTGGILFYKIQLTSTDVAVTPTISDAQVDYDGTVVPALSGNSYPTQGAVVSTNLLTGGTMAFDNTVRFAYNVSSLPSGTSASVQFSQDGTNWYSSGGTLWGEDVLSSGAHLDITNSLDLSALNWSGVTSFYYKLNLYSPLDDNLTPAVSDAGLINPDQVYYSVGQSVANLMSGAPTVTITGGAGVFSVAQTGNIGVGDRVTYNTSAVAYISAKTNADGMHWSLVTATGGLPGDISNSAVVSITREFTSLNSAEAAASNIFHINSSDLVSANVVLNLPCYYDTGADTTEVTVDSYTTSANNYIKIYTPNNTSTEVNNSQRHQGKWDDGKYRLNVTGIGILNSAHYTIIDGLQISISPNDTYRYGIRGNNNIGGMKISNNIIKQLNAQDNSGGIYIATMPSGYKSFAYNNIIYDIVGSAYFFSSVDIESFYIFNNTAHGNTVGFRDSGQDIIVKNNLAYDNGTDYVGTFSSSSTNNISKDATSPNSGSTDCGGHSCRSQTISFVDAINKDFHLSPSDTAAKNAGADLSADANFPFNTDIDGSFRLHQGFGATQWDIGADETATQIFRSVGPSATAVLESDTAHARNVTLTSGVATFSNALADNIGVGDAILIDTGGTADAIDTSDTLLFVHGRTDSTHYTLRTHTGAIPTDITVNNTYQIFRAYTSLSNAEAGTKNTSIPITFNGGNRDLVVNNEQWNIACYGDAVDTTSVTIDGWNTGENNFIKVYTPVYTEEVGVSQRHKGNWDDGKYQLSKENVNGYTIYILDEYIEIDGLQFDVSGTGTHPNAVKIGANNIILSNSMIKDSSLNSEYIINIEGTFGDVKVINNIVYRIDDLKVGTGIRSYSSTNLSMGYFYNNTVNGFNVGIESRNNSVLAKNNIVQNCTNGYNSGFDASSDYNISDLAADAPGANSKNSTTVSFVDATNKDFHLSSSDTAARNAGISLANDSALPFDTDIDGQERTGQWSVGADDGPGVTVQTPAPNSTESPNLDINTGLVGYWSFDGETVSGSTVEDLSSYKNDGTISGVTKAIGKRGQGMNFDGNDYIQVNDNDMLDGANAMSWSFWIKLADTGSSNRGIINKYITSVGGRSYNIFIDAGEDINLRISSDGVNNEIQIAQTNLDTNWNHVAIIFNNGAFNVYKNGQVVSDDGDFTSHISVYAGSDDLDLGRDYSGNYYNGQFDETRIYNRALTIDEIGHLYRMGEDKFQTTQTDKLTDGLVGMWSFDGPDVNIATNTAFDRSGNGNNGTISGATPVIGKKGQGFSFNAIQNQYVGTVKTFDPIFTYVAWINVSSVSAVRYIIGPLGNGAPGFSVNTNRTLLLQRTGIATVGSSTGTVTLNSWNHIAVTYNSSTGDYSFYINGALAGNGNNIASFILTQWLQIGARYSGNLGFQGKIDEVRVYDRVLSEEEIDDLYRLGSVKIKK
ncbi:MAG: PKD domain containing protein [Candidatus Moranbacteria bacterium GW2011_GWE1_35_17]|nr:MAG: PKD domain containing protein [Candidatus Moranbacteria bacterium GW2011_GWE1_35_17]